MRGYSRRRVALCGSRAGNMVANHPASPCVARQAGHCDARQDQRSRPGGSAGCERLFPAAGTISGKRIHRHRSSTTQPHDNTLFGYSLSPQDALHLRFCAGEYNRCAHRFKLNRPAWSNNHVGLTQSGVSDSPRTLQTISLPRLTRWPGTGACDVKSKQQTTPA